MLSHSVCYNYAVWVVDLQDQPFNLGDDFIFQVHVERKTAHHFQLVPKQFEQVQKVIPKGKAVIEKIKDMREGHNIAPEEPKFCVPLFGVPHGSQRSASHFSLILPELLLSTLKWFFLSPSGPGDSEVITERLGGKSILNAFSYKWNFRYN